MTAGLKDTSRSDPVMITLQKLSYFAGVLPANSGAPPTTTRVGSPPVCESITCNLRKLDIEKLFRPKPAQGFRKENTTMLEIVFTLTVYKLMFIAHVAKCSSHL